MSVTTILRDSNEWPELRDFIKESCPKYTDLIVKGAPNFTDTLSDWLENAKISQREATLIGDLVDYLFAITLCRQIDQHKDIALKSILRYCNFFTAHFACSDFVLKKVQEIKTVILEFSHGKDVAFSSLVDASHSLFILENNSIGKLEEALNTQILENIQFILFKMVSLFESVFIGCGLINSQSIVLLHPRFGLWGFHLGGAIGDLYIDGNIYEIKSGAQLKSKWTDIGQVYTYYLLNQLCTEDIENKRDPGTVNSPYDLCGYNVDGIALYYTRAGIVQQCNVKKISDIRNHRDETVMRKIIATNVNCGKKRRYEHSLSLHAQIIAEKRFIELRSGKRLLTHYKSKKHCPYNIGERVFLRREGWGTIEGITQVNQDLIAVVSMDNNKRWKVDINKVELLSVHDSDLVNSVPAPNYLPEE